MAAGEAPRLLRQSWEQRRGVMCRGVNWDRHSLEELQLVVECIGGPCLAAVFRVLAQDHAGWSGGCLVWGSWESWVASFPCLTARAALCVSG